MTTGPRNTPYPIILHVDATGTPVRLAESSSIYVASVSALTISATTYLGLEPGGGVPGGVVGNIQVKSGNTTFAGYNPLRYDTGLGALLANLVSSTSLSAVSAHVGTISATNYLNIPKTNLSSLLDVQYASVSGGQALIYSSSISKWAPGYTIYKSDAVPGNSVGVNGDIYLQYTDDLTNAAYLSSLLDTNINAISNGQSLIWSSGYWIPSALSTATTGAITNIPSASPIWNAASAEGYDIQFGIVSPVTPLDIIGFSFEATPRITNFAPQTAASLLVNLIDLSGLKDSAALNGAPENSLIYRYAGAGFNGWGYTTDPRVNTLSAATLAAVDYQGLPSSVPTWNADKIQWLSATFTNPQILDVLSVGPGNTIRNVAASTAAVNFAGFTNLSSLADVWETQPQENNILIYTDGYWEPSNSISLVNVSSTNLSSVNVFGTQARITNVSATTISATNWKGLPSAIPYWNAASAGGYEFQFGLATPVSPFDIVGFSLGSTITNFAPVLAGPVLAQYINLSALADAGTLLGAPPNSLITRTTTNPQGNWVATLDPTLNSITVGSLFAVSAELSSVKLTRYVEPKSTVNISSSSIVLDLNTAQVFEISAISNISSITIQNPTSRTNVIQEFTIIFSADGTQRAVTNWGSIKWAGASEPILTATKDKKDIFSFMSPDNGINWYAFIEGQNF